MASYVQHAKNILADKAPNFMELNSINAPPIDFADAMKKARAAVEGKVTELIGQGVDSNLLLAAVNRDARLTFSYLLMQLHGRGGQTFWQETAAEDIFAYIAFRVTDIYADILTHIEVEGFHCAPLLEELCSTPTIENWRELYTGLRIVIMKQRQSRGLVWSPTQSDVNDVFQHYADREVLRGAGRAASWGIGGLAVVAGVAVLGLMWLRSRK